METEQFFRHKRNPVRPHLDQIINAPQANFWRIGNSSYCTA